MKKRLFTLVLLVIIVQYSQAKSHLVIIWTEGNATLTYLNTNKNYDTGDYFDGQMVTGTNSAANLYNPDEVQKKCKTVVFTPSLLGNNVEELTPVIFSGLGNMFGGFEKLTSIVGLEYLNTSHATAMYQMFLGCSSLEVLDLSTFNTSNVEDMQSMFSGCSSLKSLKLSSFDTSKVTNMLSMFSGCSSLESLDLTNFNTSNVTDMRFMFRKCSSLDTLDLSSFDTSNVTNMKDMFCECSLLKNLDLGHFNTSNVTDMSDMFRECPSLVNLNLKGFNTSNVTDMSWMFYDCSSLDSLDLSCFDTSNVTDMSWMFSHCSSLDSLDLSCFDTSNVTDMHWMFSGCSLLKKVDLSSFDTPNVTNMSLMFYDCSSLDSLDLSCFDTSNVTDMGWMFSGCSSLISLNIDNFDASNVENLFKMFSGCSSLKALNISFINPRKATNMSDMFSGCSSLKALDLSTFDTSTAIYMTGMFSNCTSIDSLDLSKFNTYNVKSMSSMFKNCTNLKTMFLDIGFNTDEVVVDDNLPSFEGVEGLTIFVPSANARSKVRRAMKKIGLKQSNGNIVYRYTVMQVIMADKTVDFAESLTDDEGEPLDLDDIVIDNVYYNLEDNDGYDTEEGCLVINTPTDMTLVSDCEIGSESLVENYHGIILQVNGKGIIKADCQTIGLMKINLQIGISESLKVAKIERGKVELLYDVSTPTFLYIYATTDMADTQKYRAKDASNNSVKMYSLSLEPIDTSVKQVTNFSKNSIKHCYGLDGRKHSGIFPSKGIHILDGRKVIAK